jgi:uncharacterized protein YggT (Ycf19 family)
MLKAIARLIDFITWVITFLLIARVVMSFFGTKATAPLVEWLYSTTDDLIAPFVGIFPNIVLSTGHVIDVTAIVAAVIYGIVGFAIAALIESLANHLAYKPPATQEMVSPNPTAPSVVAQKPINEPVDLKPTVK